jgi:hypothetical protein
MVVRRAEKAEICLPLGITIKSDFVFTRPRPRADMRLLNFPRRKLIMKPARQLPFLEL